ncbi:MAG: hypothetical protein NT002_01105 [candidate division Zixibacteria bacterium]|nr:hypothetical protein [candidate division Zixibacteria bacterium]
MRYGVGVRALTMGRAYVGLADDAASIYYNPAGLMQLEKMEFHAMGVNLYDQSCYSYFAIGLPRPDWGKNRLTNFFLGPNASWGVSWINLNSGDFDRRNAQDKWQGTSSVNQNAWHLGFAREEILFGSWAILDWGTSFKVIRQEVFKSSGWSYGADLGVQLRFINPPGSKRFPSLRTILPLRIGLSLQNAIIPKVNLDGAAEKYPPSLKAGWSYAWTVSERFKLIAANDYEWLFRSRARGAFWKYGSYPERGVGIFGGVEGQYCWPGVTGFVRAGMNNRQDDFTLGCGLKKKIFGLDLGFDYCYVFHDLGEIDNYRISLTLRKGAARDAGHFRGRSRWTPTESIVKPCGSLAISEGKPDSTLSPSEVLFEKEIRLQALARYSYEGRSDTVLIVAKELAKIFDMSNEGRYWDFIGGPDKAASIFRKAKEAFHFIKHSDTAKARDKAGSLAEQSKIVYEPELGHNLSDTHLMNLAEIYLMLGNYDSAGICLARIDETVMNKLRLNYLRGVYFKSYRDSVDYAIGAFTSAIEVEKECDSASMLNLSVLGLADCLYNEGQYDAAIAILLPLIEGCNMPLDSDYPRYPIFADGNIADDALFIIGQCYESKNEIDNAILIFALLGRFCYTLDKYTESQIGLKNLLGEK